MIDPYMQREIADAKKTIDRLISGVSWIREHADGVTQIAHRIEAMAIRFPSPFDKVVLRDRTWTYLQRMAKDHARMVAWAERGRENHMLISSVLPKRGWYLSGKEPCTLSDRLAKAVREERWGEVDQVMMGQLPKFNVDTLQEWLLQEGVPEYCINRLCRFLKHHEEGNYEEATYLGIPLLDEIAKHLYGGKTFTTKRGRRKRGDQSKPELAFKTPCSPGLASYCEAFVQTFGSLQEDPKQDLLTDEDYWNRHAIVHGLVQRAMGVKDSAKCLMAFKFLFFARENMDDGESH